MARVRQYPDKWLLQPVDKLSERALEVRGFVAVIEVALDHTVDGTHHFGQKLLGVLFVFEVA